VEKMNIMDLTGRIIETRKSFTSQVIELDLTTEAVGVYFLTIEINGKNKTFRIVKK